METLQIWPLCKLRIFPDPEISRKTKIDIRNASIEGVFNYGVSLLQITESAGRKYNNLQQNASGELHISQQTKTEKKG